MAIRAATDDARDLTLVVRLRVPSGEAGIPLGAKFGVAPEAAPALLARTRQAARRLGLAFHVGSQQTDAAAWDRAMDAAERVVRLSGSDAASIYRRVLQRTPTADEASLFEAFASETSWVDATHALLASTEFRLLE